MSKGWIGVDLDGTLAHYEYGQSWDATAIGAPIGPMVERVRRWVWEYGHDVRIFTARVSNLGGDRDYEAVVGAIQDWCRLHIGKALPITNVKDFHMIELWDDRCVQVVVNTGAPAGRSTRGLE